MTKRRRLAMIIALVMCVSLSACSGGETESTESDVKFEVGKFIIVEEGQLDDTQLYQYIMYDPETMVMYTFISGFKSGGPTVMYNADGTPKIYSLER